MLKYKISMFLVMVHFKLVDEFLSGVYKLLQVMLALIFVVVWYSINLV